MRVYTVDGSAFGVRLVGIKGQPMPGDVVEADFGPDARAGSSDGVWNDSRFEVVFVLAVRDDVSYCVVRLA